MWILFMLFSKWPFFVYIYCLNVMHGRMIQVIAQATKSADHILCKRIPLYIMHGRRNQVNLKASKWANHFFFCLIARSKVLLKVKEKEMSLVVTGNHKLNRIVIINRNSSNGQELMWTRRKSTLYPLIEEIKVLFGDFRSFNLK